MPGSPDVRKQAFDFYISQGLQPHQAAAMVGHMIGESGGNTQTVHDGGTGYGIFGFRDPTPGQGRKTDLMNYAKSGTGVELDPNALETQLRFSLHELDHGEKAAGAKLYAAQNYQQAVDAGMHYLRPAGYTPDNPQAGHNYAGRFNAGAQLAGVDPMQGGVAPGPNQGLLAQQQPVMPYNDPNIDTRTRFADAEIAGWGKSGETGLLGSTDASTAKAGAGLSSVGTSMMMAKPQQAAPQKLVEAAHDPQAQAQGQGNPDFVQQLAQMRLKKPMLGGLG